MQVKLVFAALLGSVFGSASFASAMTIAPLATPDVVVQKAHMVKMCERGRGCFWTYHHPGWRQERWGYSGPGPYHGGYNRGPYYNNRDYR